MSTESLSPEETQIRSASTPRCIVCNGEGRVIQSGLRDRLFGAWGGWHLKQCSNGRCGLAWLDPMPLPRDIGKAYKEYYTHLPEKGISCHGYLGRLRDVIRRGYLGREYNYSADTLSPLAKSAGMMLNLMPYRRAGIDESVRFLPAMPGGRVLDVGCGSGEWLAYMRHLGWGVEGVDCDEAAVGIARARGLKVGCGSIEDQAYPGGIFDAVTLNHVIEHVPDPAGTLAECARVLKPNGLLVLLTPNIASLGYRVFGENWRGLEPPRHLHLMSPESIRVLLNRAGFAKTRVSTRNSGFMWHQSLMLRAGGVSEHGRMRSGMIGEVGAILMMVLESALLTLNPNVGECIATISEHD